MVCALELSDLDTVASRDLTFWLSARPVLAISHTMCPEATFFSGTIDPHNRRTVHGDSKCFKTVVLPGIYRTGRRSAGNCSACQ